MNGDLHVRSLILSHLYKQEISRQLFEKYSCVRFHEKLSSGSRVVACGQTDMTKLKVAFRNFAIAPKNQNRWSAVRGLNPEAPRNTKHSVTLSNTKWPLSDVSASDANSCLLECDAVHSGESEPAFLFRRILGVRLRLKCDGTRAETRLRLSAKRASPLKSAGASVQSSTGRRDVRISGSNAGYTMFRGSVKGTGYPLHSPVSPPLPSRASPCAITFRLDSTAVQYQTKRLRLL